jgi:hypothetical protein
MHRIVLVLVLGWLALACDGQAATVTISWTPPTDNEDGSPLTDLAGYHVYIGQTSGHYDQMLPVGLTTSITHAGYVEGQTYVWAVTAVDTSGNESRYSVEVSKTIPYATMPPDDTTTPVVEITSPSPGATVSRKARVTITAQAFDNVGVTVVEFYVDTRLVCPPDQSSPYACTWEVPAAGGDRRYQLHATAYDAAQNVGRSPVVEVVAK